MAILLGILAWIACRFYEKTPATINRETPEMPRNARFIGSMTYVAKGETSHKARLIAKGDRVPESTEGPLPGTSVEPCVEGPLPGTDGEPIYDYEETLTFEMVHTGLQSKLARHMVNKHVAVLEHNFVMQLDEDTVATPNKAHCTQECPIYKREVKEGKFLHRFTIPRFSPEGVDRATRVNWCKVCEPTPQTIPPVDAMYMQATRRTPSRPRRVCLCAFTPTNKPCNRGVNPETGYCGSCSPTHCACSCGPCDPSSGSEQIARRKKAVEEANTEFIVDSGCSRTMARDGFGNFDPWLTYKGSRDAYHRQIAQQERSMIPEGSPFVETPDLSREEFENMLTTMKKYREAGWL